MKLDNKITLNSSEYILIYKRNAISHSNKICLTETRVTRCKEPYDTYLCVTVLDDGAFILLGETVARGQSIVRLIDAAYQRRNLGLYLCREARGIHGLGAHYIFIP